MAWRGTHRAMDDTRQNPVSEAPMKLGQVLQASAEFLRKRGVDSPRVAAELLAARLLKCRRLDLACRHDAVLPEKLMDAMRRGVMRVGRGEPVQYVVGQWGFRNLVLKTDRRALIPRPETEELVQLLLDCKPLRELPAPRILDYGTGSGCIALSIAAEMPSAVVVGVDVSGDALDLARENADALGLSGRVSFLNTLDVDLADVVEPGAIDAVISNPPYIPTASCAKLAPVVRDHEPAGALDGGPDGMDVIRHIIEESAILLASGGRIFLELGAEDRQAGPVSRYMADIGFDGISTHRDMSGAERFVSGVLAGGL